MSIFRPLCIESMVPKDACGERVRESCGLHAEIDVGTVSTPSWNTGVLTNQIVIMFDPVTT